MYTNYYPSSQLFHASVPLLMGTRLDMLLFGEDPAALDILCSRMEIEIRRVERLLNRFDPESALYRVNRDAAICPVGMAGELWTVLQDCRRYFEWTDGCFDITRGRFDAVEFDDVNRTVFLKGRADFDLGGYGKGYALRQLRRLLEEEAVVRALINFGDSSVLAVGTHPHGDCWPVGIDNPCTGERTGVMRLRDCSLSVSGNRPARPAHIVNPETGVCVTGRKTVAVAAVDPVDAEALTTALMVAVPGKVENIVNRFKIIEYKLYE
ncbi:MAG: FAD:protein FMN transferase [Tannerella sp.]|jgi:thiamine biosynthesis lipoprotein|nr:FAD:protein FMN transferase [Tannerella sp.]